MGVLGVVHHIEGMGRSASNRSHRSLSEGRQRWGFHTRIKASPKVPEHGLDSEGNCLVTDHMASPPKVEHTLGVAHVLADKLSRCSEEEVEDLSIHPDLKNSSRVFQADPDRSWYRTLLNFSST